MSFPEVSFDGIGAKSVTYKASAGLIANKIAGVDDVGKACTLTADSEVGIVAGRLIGKIIQVNSDAGLVSVQDEGYMELPCDPADPVVVGNSIEVNAGGLIGDTAAENTTIVVSKNDTVTPKTAIVRIP